MTGAVTRVLRISRTVADIARAEAFYRDALGFTAVEAGAIEDPAWFRLMGAGGAAERRLMRLGAGEIELLAFTPPGRPYPPDPTATDPWFQHAAIVVRDAAAAYHHLRRHPFTPITRDGPQRLPPGAGSVTAYKFRDPDGHPLELIAFPSGPWSQVPGTALFLGMDHSAIVVADAGRSAAFYAGLLGLTEAARSRNHGPEQERLDDTPGDVVDVVALQPARPGPPHVELLGYRAGARPRPPETIRSDDLAATRFVMETGDLPALAAALQAAGTPFVSPGVVALRDGSLAALVRDPDGHGVLLVQPPG